MAEEGGFAAPRFTRDALRLRGEQARSLRPEMSAGHFRPRGFESP